MHTISRSIAFALLPTLLSAAPYLCRNNNATYQTQAHCNTDCGTSCEELDPLSSGTSGSCDMANFEGFVYSNNITYAITKSKQFWTDTANLALPKDEQINAVLKGIASYYGGNAWIGVYDPLKSSNYNSVDPSRFKLSNGIALTYSNWSNGQPDNKLDNADIGVMAINGEHWVYIQSDATWLDDGYHAIYGGDNKPKRKALVEWSGPLDCVSGTPKSTTSNTNGYYCGDGTGNVAECTMGSVPSSSNACTAPATWDSVNQKCKTTYTATAASTTTTYAATVTNGLTWDNCDGKLYSRPQAVSYCQNRGKRLPTASETIAGGGSVPSCSGLSGQTWTSTTVPTWMVWNGTVLSQYDSSMGLYGFIDARCVSNTTTYSCLNGDTLSGSTCTTTTTAYTCDSGGTLSGTTCTMYQDPSCPSGTQLNTSTGTCDPISACTAPAVWNSTTQKCESSGTTTYSATASTAFGWDNCEGGTQTWSPAISYCSSKGMQLPALNETTAGGGTVPSCTTTSGYTWTSTPLPPRSVGQSYKGTATYSANTTSTLYQVRCVGDVTTYTCDQGDTLSGSTCSKSTTISTSGVCPQNMTPDPSTGYCATPTICPLGNYQCALINSSTIENTDTTEGANDKTDNGQTDESGKCLGTLYIFNGNDNRCRPSGVQTGGTDCCKKGTTWFGLGQCQESEKTLGKLREFGSLDGNCHYIGDYCSEKWPLVGCVQKKKTYCCFSSPLARIIQEGGRPQLGIGWGSPEAPQCRGFTPEEFQKIDFSKVNFSEWIQYDVVPNVQNNAVGNIQNVINNIDTNLAP